MDEFIGRRQKIAAPPQISLLRAISDSHPQVTTLRDLGINSSSSTTLTSTLIRHFSSMQKPRDSMTVVFDDHDISDDMDTGLQLDFPVLPPQQSVFDGLETFEKTKEKMTTVRNLCPLFRYPSCLSRTSSSSVVIFS